MQKIIHNLNLKNFFNKLAETEKNICFTYSNSSNGWEKCLAWNPAEIFSIKLNKEKFKIENFKKFVFENTKKNRKLIGFISYDLGYVLYNIKKNAKDDLKLPDIFFCSFDNYLILGESTKAVFKKKNFINEINDISKRSIIKNKNEKISSANFSPTITKSNYSCLYDKIKNYIREGDIYQINLTHRLEGISNKDPKELFLKILQNNNVDFLAYIEGPGFEILSASPERFIKIKKNHYCPNVS